MKTIKTILRHLIILLIGLLVYYVGTLDCSMNGFINKFFECSGIFIILIYIFLCLEMKN